MARLLVFLILAYISGITPRRFFMSTIFILPAAALLGVYGKFSAKTYSRDSSHCITVCSGDCPCCTPFQLKKVPGLTRVEIIKYWVASAEQDHQTMIHYMKARITIGVFFLGTWF